MSKLSRFIYFFASEAEKNDGGGDEKMFVVNISWDETTEKYVADKTLAEMNEAVNRGQCVVVEDNGNYFYLVYISETAANFVQISFGEANGYSSQFDILVSEETGEQTVDYHTYIWDVVDDT